MSDNIYKVLMGDNAPFSGMANISYYDKILRGKIVKVHYDIYSPISDSTTVVFNQQSYRTVDIEWLEGKPFTSEYVHIPEMVSFLGYGLNYLPSVNDIVLAGFDSTDNPHVLTIVARCSAYEHGALDPKKETSLILNSFGDPIIDDIIPEDIRPTPIRRIEPGEISLTSLNNNSELFFDKYGTAKLISRVPVLDKQVEESTGKIYKSGLQCGDRLWEIGFGQKVYDESSHIFREELNGNPTEFIVLNHKNGSSISADGLGNINIYTGKTNIYINKEGKITISVGGNGETPAIFSCGESVFYAPLLILENKQLRMCLSSDGKSWDICNQLANQTFEENIEHRIKFGFNLKEQGSEKAGYYLKYKKGSDWKDLITISETEKRIFCGAELWFLNSCMNARCFNSGKMNLKSTTINYTNKNGSFIFFDGNTAQEKINYVNHGCDIDNNFIIGGKNKFLSIVGIPPINEADSWEIETSFQLSGQEFISIDQNSVILGDGETQQAVLGNNLQSLLIELVNAFNSHVHTGNMGFPTDSPTVTVDMQNILSDTVEVK